MLSSEDFNGIDFTPHFISEDEAHGLVSEKRVARLREYQSILDSDFFPEIVAQNLVSYDIIHPCFDQNGPSEDKRIAVSVHTFAPPNDTPIRGVLLFQHGMNDHGLRFSQYLYEEFLKNGIAIVAPDQPACGTSDGPMGSPAHSIFEWIVTLRLAHSVSLKRFPESLPRILMGHSLGGLTVFWAARVFPEIRTGGVIIYNAALEIERRMASPSILPVLDHIPRGLNRMVVPTPITESPALHDTSKERCAVASIHGPLMRQFSSVATVSSIYKESKETMRLLTDAFRKRWPGADNCEDPVCWCFISKAANKRQKAQGFAPIYPWSSNGEPCLPGDEEDPLDSNGDGHDTIGLGSRVMFVVGSDDPVCEWRRAWQASLAMGGPDYVLPGTRASECGTLRLITASDAVNNIVDARRPFLCLEHERHECLRDAGGSKTIPAIVQWCLKACKSPEDAVMPSPVPPLPSEHVANLLASACVSPLSPRVKMCRTADSP